MGMERRLSSVTLTEPAGKPETPAAIILDKAFRPGMTDAACCRQQKRQTELKLSLKYPNDIQAQLSSFQGWNEASCPVNSGDFYSGKNYTAAGDCGEGGFMVEFFRRYHTKGLL